MFQRALSPLSGSGGGNIKSGTIEDITTISTQIEIDTGVRNIKRFVLFCDYPNNYLGVLCWDKDRPFSVNGTKYAPASIGNSTVGSVTDVGTANTAGTIMSIDETTGKVVVSSSYSSGRIPMTNIYWYAE